MEVDKVPSAEETGRRRRRDSFCMLRSEHGYAMGRVSLEYLEEMLPSTIRTPSAEEQFDDSSDDDDLSKPDSGFSRTVRSVTKAFNKTRKKYETGISYFWLVLLTVLYFTYFGYAMYLKFDVNDEGCMRLLVITVLATVFVIARTIWNRYLANQDGLTLPFVKKERENEQMEMIRRITSYVFMIGSIIFIIIWIIVDVALTRVENLRSAVGLVAFVLLLFIFSKHPAQVRWKTVFWGLCLQFYFALIILRWTFGYQAFDWVGKIIVQFFDHTTAGADFVLGPKRLDHFFIFVVMPLVTFFSAAVSVLYYLGVMQFIINNIARCLTFCLGTSPPESLNAAGNIFFGQSESSVLIRPYLIDMTKSELHSVCTSGFASIAGSLMAAYMSMGIPAVHLLSATVMSAPAALAMSKLFYPETKKPKTTDSDVYETSEKEEHNLIEAACNGASISISLIANISVNLIAFIAILDAVNSSLAWLGHRVGMYEPALSFNLICGYLFYPLPWLMGAELDDLHKLASMIGTKIFINEFVAFTDLGAYVSNTKTYNDYMANTTLQQYGTTMVGDDVILNYSNITLKGGIIAGRSVVISTYALCGFSNVSSMGIMIGAVSAMAPPRKKDVTKIVVRAMIAGNVACFMTACIAGLLYQGPA